MKTKIALALAAATFLSLGASAQDFRPYDRDDFRGREYRYDRDDFRGREYRYNRDDFRGREYRYDRDDRRVFERGYSEGLERARTERRRDFRRDW